MPIQLLFHALLLLDPLVALLIIRARPSGPLLAAVVMLADLVGNWDVEWRAVSAHPAAFLQPVGLLPITLFGVLVLLTAFPLRRALTSGGDANAHSSSQTANTMTEGTSA